jgi:hypothetical protein
MQPILFFLSRMSQKIKSGTSLWFFSIIFLLFAALHPVDARSTKSTRPSQSTQRTWWKPWNWFQESGAMDKKGKKTRSAKEKKQKDAHSTWTFARLREDYKKLTKKKNRLAANENKLINDLCSLGGVSSDAIDEATKHECATKPMPLLLAIFHKQTPPNIINESIYSAPVGTGTHNFNTLHFKFNTENESFKKQMDDAIEDAKQRHIRQQIAAETAQLKTRYNKFFMNEKLKSILGHQVVLSFEAPKWTKKSFPNEE